MAQAFVRIRGTEKWGPVTMQRQPFIQSKEVIQAWLNMLAPKFPNNEYKIELDEGEKNGGN